MHCELPVTEPVPVRISPDPGELRFALVSRGGMRLPRSGWLRGAEQVFDVVSPGEWNLEFEREVQPRTVAVHVPATIVRELSLDVSAIPTPGSRSPR